MTKNNTELVLWKGWVIILFIGFTILVLVNIFIPDERAYQKGFEAGQNNMGLIKDIIQLKIGELDRSCHHLDNQTICFYPNGTWTASWRSP